MNIGERLALIREVGEEIVTEDELRLLLESKAHPVAYDGFEPSGKIHIAQGLLRAINVNKMTKAGVRFKMFVADWHAWANNKMGGDLAKIQTTGKYIVETWKATGMDLANVDFVWASEFVNDEAYWKKVMNIARDASLDRVLRTTQIMGRSDKDKLSAAQILYPCMQAADIFHLKADITQLGMDQRKVNMLAREAGPKLGFWKPVVVSHHMMMGLQQPPPLPRELSFEQARAQFQGVSTEIAEIDFVLERDPEYPAGETLMKSVRKLHEQLGADPTKYEQEMRDFFKSATKTIPSFVDPQNPAIRSEQENQLFIELVKAPSLKEAADAYRRLRSELGPVPSGSSKARIAAEAETELLTIAINSYISLMNEFVARRESFAVERATAMKMSKSNPDSAIFMTDSTADVERKVKKAYCPEKIIPENPVLEYAKYIVFERFPAVTVERPEKFGGTVTFHSYPEMETAYSEGKLHPADLKKVVATSVNKLLDPVREHFQNNASARALKEQVDSFQITR